jgi:alkanesulfonate monooxygenase SsuD/methylene tetrahydromethanopterin reductase-like flavin-dependent oxidoreductase (luciferase family)
MARIDILVPQAYPDGLPDAQDLSAYMRAAEDLGFGGLWVIDRLFHQTPVLDGYTTMVWAAANTSRVRLGSAVLLMPFRNPALLARQIATVDALTAGRVTLGISLGGRENEHATVGATYRQRARRLEEGVEVLRQLFAGADVTYKGRYFELAGATISPRPYQGANLPILLGAGSDAGLARAGRIGDGWIAGGGGSAQKFAANWQKVQAAAVSAGRQTGALENAKLFYMWVDDDTAAAQARVERYVHAYYGPRYDINNAVFGSPAACAERLRAFIDAGCQTLILGPSGLDIRQLETIQQRLVPLLS